MTAKNMSVKQRLKDDEVVIGSWLGLGSEAATEILCRAGYAFLVVDLEHTPIGLETAERLIRVIEGHDKTSLVRLSTNDPVLIKRVMDSGAHGIVVPMINTRSELDQAYAALHYPPRGVRGVGLARAQHYSPAGFESYRAWLAQEALLVAQIEHVNALANLDAIFAHPHLDAYLIGPYDLSASMGLAGQLDHPEVKAAMVQIAAAAARVGVPSGIHIVEPDPAALAARRQQGYRFIAYSVDYRMLDHAARHGGPCE